MITSPSRSEVTLGENLPVSASAAAYAESLEVVPIMAAGCRAMNR